MRRDFQPFNRRRQKTAQQSLTRNHWSGGPETLDVGEVKKADETFPTTPRIRTEEEKTRAKSFGWINS